MATRNEAETRKTAKRPDADKREKDPNLEGAEDPDRQKPEKEESPLKTVGGTPIIERTPEG